MHDGIKPGDVIQVNPAAEGIDPCWRGVLMLVEEIRKWGIVAVAFTPEVAMNDFPPGRFYLRLRLGNEPGEPKYFKVGKCPMVPGDIASKLWPDLSYNDEGWIYLD